ncbi:nuclear transport factor 2 family protein [Phycisphaerales bacterium AB-hyl4]|uniref:Nuclear transport factor 2 family protein n=1 Tax=Natronomicrosphaera hydrolytica TaxID=3242702 RepID=A0ABV4U2B5_9BACT
MGTTTTPSAAEAEILELVDRYVEAIRSVDAERIASHYAPDILAFDAIAHLQFKGVEAYRKHWEACIAMCSSEGMTFELHEPSIAVNGDVAFGHWLCRCGPGPDESGKEQAAWMRGTIGFRKTDGKWTIVHEHWSAPFDPESNKAMFDLQP